jgi:hypothetical protein
MGNCGRNKSIEIAAPTFMRSTSDRDMPDAGNKQKSLKIMKIIMFAILDKAKPNTGNISGLNLAAVICTTVQVSKLLW